MVEQITYPRLRELLGAGAQFVEVLPEDEFIEAHLPGAINIPLKRLAPGAVSALDRSRAVVVYCWDRL
jgi:rhodanese-related sulfurtransferase